MKTVQFFLLLILTSCIFVASGSGRFASGFDFSRKPEVGSPSFYSNSPTLSSSFFSEPFHFKSGEEGILKSSFFTGDPEKTIAEKIRTRTWISGSLFAASHATGYLLASSDKPYSTALLAVHKITSASNLVMLDITLFQKNKITRLTTGEKVAAIILNAAFVATIGTGGRLSMKKPAPVSIQNIHQFAPYVTTISAGALLYLLNKNQ